MSNTPNDPAVQWSHLLGTLSASVREAVVASLRHAAESDRAMTDASVEALVAYAEGRIDSRTYASRTLSALGFDPVLAEHPSIEPAMTHTASYAAMDASFPDYSAPPTAAQYAPPTPARPYETPGESAVQAYVSGHISVEEFLRVPRGRHNE